jgi:pimeloyl-ACP methyl ester carboxylesterase
MTPYPLLSRSHSAGGQLAIWAAHFAALAHRVTDASGAVLDSDWEPWPLAGRALVPDLVVAIAPVSDLVEACRARLSDDGDAVQNYLGGDPAGNERAALAAARASPVAACMPCAVPTLVVSGRKDTDVPTEIALRYVAQQPPALEPARAWAAPMVLDDADHYAVFDGASAAFFAIVERAEAMLASDGGSVRPAV